MAVDDEMSPASLPKRRQSNRPPASAAVYPPFSYHATVPSILHGSVSLLQKMMLPPHLCRSWIQLIVVLAIYSIAAFIDAYQIGTSPFTGIRLRPSSAPVVKFPCCCSWTMKLRVGILGLPNVGKSSLFNAMARQSLAHAANFPFCTIDPTTCLVPIEDPYLDQLATWSPAPLNSRRRVVPATMEWVDVAGLAKNAHRGEGLGNQFLGTLRDCSCLCHMVRAFEDPNILVHHQENDDDEPCDPRRDLETIELELVLADLAHVQRRLERMDATKKDDDGDEEERLVLQQVQKALQDGIPARTLGLSSKQQFAIRSMGLLTLKPVLYAFNVDEVDFFLNRDDAEMKAQNVLREYVTSWTSTTDSARELPPFALVCANVESQLSQYASDEKTAYLKSIGADTSSSIAMEENGSTMTATRTHPLCFEILPKLVQNLLGYSICYTGPGVPLERSQTTRAHLIPSSSFTAVDLAGRIHGDIQKGFLRAQVINAYRLLTEASDFVQAKELGILRAEGKDYILQDGEVVLIQWKGG